MTHRSAERRIRVGLLTSIGRTLDAFFPPIAERLEATGFSVFSASGGTSSIQEWTALRGFSQRPSPAAFPAAVRSVRRWVRDCGLDIVVTNTATASAISRAAGLAVPVVYFCHGLHWEREDELSARPWQLVERCLLPRTAAVVTLNRADEQWFRRHTRRPVTRLPYGVGVPLDRYPAAPVPEGAPRLLWVGDFTPRKRPHEALTVLRHIRAGGTDARLRMLGDGPLRQAILSEVADTGLASVLTAEGRGDVPSALREATALLHTAAWEGLPRVALEAAAVGRWCYGFDVKGVGDAPLVRVVPDGDVVGLASAVEADHSDGSVRAVPDIRSELDVTNAADLLGDVVRQAVAGGR